MVALGARLFLLCFNDVDAAISSATPGNEKDDDEGDTVGEIAADAVVVVDGSVDIVVILVA